MQQSWPSYNTSDPVIEQVHILKNWSNEGVTAESYVSKNNYLKNHNDINYKGFVCLVRSPNFDEIRVEVIDFEKKDEVLGYTIIR